MKDKVSNIAFYTMLAGFVVLVSSFSLHSEKMGIVALLLILPSITLNVARRWIKFGNEEYFIKDQFKA